jgi:VWFA-related protein
MTPRAPWVTGLTVIASAAVLLAQQTVFRSAVDSVSLDVAVFEKGHAVSGLSAADFEVRDNNVVQVLADVSHEALPIDATLVVDASASMVNGFVLPRLRRALEQVGQHVRSGDHVQLVTFNQRILQHESGTLAEGYDVVAAVGTPSGHSALLDAMAMALVTSSHADRRQMAIVFTDGRDTISVLNDQAVVDVALRTDPAIFAILLTKGSVRFPQAAPNLALFNRITAATGGRVAVLQRDEDLGKSFIQAFDDFRTSYVLRYALAGVPRPGWHDLTVRVTRPGQFTIRARKGYFG